MKLASLFSGGKDSVYALMLAQAEHDVVCLVTLSSKNPDSYMFHTPNISLTDLQSQALGIPRLEQKTSGEKNKEIDDLRKALKSAKSKYNIEGVVTGAVGSVYQATRIQTICNELGLFCFNPLWQLNQERLLNQLIENKFIVHIGAVAAYPLDESFLGKNIDATMVKKLVRLQQSHDINPAGEGGEIETIVLDAPHFKKKIVVKKSSTQYHNHAGTWIIEDAILEKK